MNLLDRMSYDTGGYTVQEILSSFCNKILEIIDLVNKNEEVCDDAHTLIEKIRNEVVPDLVDDIIKEMQDSGYFDKTVNATLINQLRTELTALLDQTITDYTNKLNNFDSQLNNVIHGKDYYNNSVLPVYDGPIISFVVDDGSNAYIDMFQYVFESNGIKPTLAIVSDWVGTNGYFTLSQLKDYKNNGYEIVGHSATHSNLIYKNNGSDRTVSADLKKCYDFLKENGFNSEVIVYPWGGFSSPNFYKNIARKYFNIGINAFAPNVINNKIPDTMYLDRLFIQKFAFNLQQIKEKIDFAKNNNGWLIFGLHTSANECDTQMLSEIINYIKLNDIKVMNISDAFKIKGNKLSIGEYDDIRSLYVNTKGETKNGFNMERWIESKNYTVDRLPDDYENGLTLLNIHPNNNGGIPCSLLNFKGDNADFYFQIKKDHDSNQLYIRQWNNTDSIWSNFNKIGFGDIETINMIPVGSYTPEVRNNVKKVNNVLHCTISLVNPNKTGTFTQDLVLCKIDKEIHSSFKGKIVPCLVTTADAQVINAALMVNRDETDGKIRITCHGKLTNSNIRWIDTEFTLIE